MPAADKRAAWLQKTVDALAAEAAADAIALWEFPRENFAAWLGLLGGSAEQQNYDDYLALLAAIEADQQRQGQCVKRVRFTVARMREELANRGWPNDPQHRAAVVGLLAGP